MARLLAPCLWLVSALVVSAAQLQAARRELLTLDEAADAAFVTSWLQTPQTAAIRKDATWFYEQGVREKKRGNWSGAAKAFGQSMIRFPDPRALSEYADAEIRMLGAVRAKSAPDNMRADMQYALNFYRSALASEHVLKVLPKPEADRLRQKAECVAAYLDSGASKDHCSPLHYFGKPPG